MRIQSLIKTRSQSLQMSYEVLAKRWKRSDSTLKLRITELSLDVFKYFTTKRNKQENHIIMKEHHYSLILMAMEFLTTSIQCMVTVLMKMDTTEWKWLKVFSTI